MAWPEIKLEKKVDAKLDTTEKANLEKLTAEDFKNQLQKLKDEKFDLSAKNKGVRLEDIVKNYNTVTHQIEIGNEQIPVGKRTDLAAWIQVLMIADWRNIRTNEQMKKWVKFWVDGYIWDVTSGAIGNYKIQNRKPEAKAETKIEDIADLSKITAYDYKYPFSVLLWNNAKSYDQYKIFDDVTWREWYFSNCIVNSSKDVTITYYSPIAKSNKTITFKRDEIIVTGYPTKVDVNKFMTALKTKLDANETKITKEKWQESVWDGVEDVKVSSFSPFMQEYIEEQKRETGWEIDFSTRSWYSGMNVSNGFVTINFPWHWDVSWSISDMQTANKFDETKFVKKLTEKMTPRAQKWKWEQLATRYNNIQWVKINSLWTTYTIDNYIKTYENINKDINAYSKNWVVLDKKIVDNIPAKIEELRNQKKYIIAKNRIDADIKSFEKRNNDDDLSRSEIITLWKEIEARVASLTKWDLYLTTTKVNVKDAFVKVGKTADYDKYFDRYKNLL